jgi:uncharacterized protein YcgL (UPF0745 family)
MKIKLNKRDNDYWLYNEYGETIASSWGVYGQKLSYQNCNEIFGIVDVIDIVYKQVRNGFDGVIDSFTEAFGKQCIKKTMELNKDKMFTIEDMRKAMDWIMTQYFEFHEQPSTGRREHYLQLLKQPIAIEVEIEMENKEYILTQNGGGFEDQTYRTWEKVPKLDSEGCLILRKI